MRTQRTIFAQINCSFGTKAGTFDSCLTSIRTLSVQNHLMLLLVSLKSIHFKVTNFERKYSNDLADKSLSNCSICEPLLT